MLSLSVCESATSVSVQQLNLKLLRVVRNNNINNILTRVTRGGIQFVWYKSSN